MPDGLKALFWICCWLAMGLLVVRTTAVKHEDWYRARDGDVENGNVVFNTIFWPVTLLIYLGNEVLPAKAKPKLDEE